MTKPTEDDQTQAELCPTCGTVMVGEGQEKYCPKCAGEIDWGMEDDEA